MLVFMKQHQLLFQKTLTAERLERLHFAVRFAQMDLPTLREGDWLNLREDFLTFLGQSRDPDQCGAVSPAGGLVSSWGDGPHPREFTEQEFRALHGDVRTILHAAAGDDMGEKPLPTVTVQATLWVRPLNGVPGGGYLTNLFGPTRDQFLFILLEDLRQEPPDRILRCPECQTLFVRAYTQAYCSRRCTNRASVRSWRARQETAAPL